MAEPVPLSPRLPAIRSARVPVRRTPCASTLPYRIEETGEAFLTLGDARAAAEELALANPEREIRILQVVAILRTHTFVRETRP